MLVEEHLKVTQPVAEKAKEWLLWSNAFQKELQARVQKIPRETEAEKTKSSAKRGPKKNDKSGQGEER